MEIKTTPRVKECFKEYKEYIPNEVLAIDISFEECAGTEWDLNGESTVIALEVVKNMENSTTRNEKKARF